ncbi:MAG TPA: CapA family protein, partial [Candidatus Syntrophosphaera sp.]|nr:CapA family protein [Candidatus Syntrophosphaera sp.]
QAYTPSFINRSGLNLAFLASSDRTGQYNNAQPYLQAGYNKPGFAYMTPYYIQQQLNAVDDVADLKIVEMHGGSEYSLTPGSGYDKAANPFLGDDQDEDYAPKTDVPHLWDIAIRHWAVDAGADLVVVHHPHIIQGFEVYQGKVIAHSLGNFVFDLDYPETMPSLIFSADADHSGFSNFLVHPIYIDGYIPKPATGQLGIHILDYLAMRSRELNTLVMVDNNRMSASVVVDDSQLQTSSHPYTYNLLLEPVTGQGNVSKPLKLPRYGSISAVNAIEPVGSADYRLGAEAIWYGNFEDEGSSLWDVEAWSTTDVFDGARSALIAPPAGQTRTATIKNRCKLYDNTKKYILHGWIKTVNATAANILLRYYNSRTGYLLGSVSLTADIDGNTDWTWYHQEVTFPANAWYYDIRLTCTGSASGQTQALFDNVGLIEWTPWTAWEANSSVINPNDYYWLQVRTPENPKSVNVHLTERRYNPLPDRSKPLPPASLELAVYPNPFRDSAQLVFDVGGKGPVSLVVYNLRGQKVAVLAEGELPAGKHQLAWNGKDRQGHRVASGLYFIRLEQNGRAVSRKAVLLH